MPVTLLPEADTNSISARTFLKFWCLEKRVVLGPFIHSGLGINLYELELSNWGPILNGFCWAWDWVFIGFELWKFIGLELRNRDCSGQNPFPVEDTVRRVEINDAKKKNLLKKWKTNLVRWKLFCRPQV